MSISTALQAGWQRAWQYKRIVLLLYVLTLGLAAFVAYPLQLYLESKLGHSLIVGEMVKGFDYTVINDFLNAYGDGITPILQQSVLSLLLYFLVLVFLQGGIVSTLLVYPAPYSRGIFWSQSAAYFWRMLRLSVYFWLLHALVLIGFIALFLLITKGLSPNALSSDTIITNSIKWLVPIYMLVLAFFLMWQDYAKVQVVRDDPSWLYRSIWSALRFIKNHFWNTYGLYLLNLLLLAVLAVINYLLSMAFDINNTFSILLSFLLSQLFVIGRLLLRLVNLGSVVAMRGTNHH